MKEIKLNLGKVVIVDDEDFEELSKYKWYFHAQGGYASRNTPMVNYKRGTCMLMHRQIMNAQRGKMVDHKNHNGLDNRRENLRLCTKSQNMCNLAKPRKDNTSGYIGVHYHKEIRKYWAFINVDGKRTNAGYYDTAEEAARARDAVALKIHGEFARTNTEWMPR